MATDSWERNTDRHIQAPWEQSEGDHRSPSAGSCSNKLDHIWKPRMDLGHLGMTPRRQSKSFPRSNSAGAIAVDGHPRQFFSLSGEEPFKPIGRGSASGSLPSTNLNHSIQSSSYATSLQLPGVLDVPDTRVPPLRTLPPWADSNASAVVPGDITNPYLRPCAHVSNDPLNADSSKKFHTVGSLNPSASSSDLNGIARRGLDNLNERTSKINAVRISKARKLPSGGINGLDIGRSLSAKIMCERKDTGHLSRSISFDRQCFIRKYTKAQSLAEEVIENLVRQMVCDQYRPNMVADMIFSPSNLCRPRQRLVAHDGNACVRVLIQRILLLQLLELSPMLRRLASNDVLFQTQKWAHTNGQKAEERYPNQGLRFLCLQQKFMGIGMETFDILCKVRSQIPRIASEDGSQGIGILPIAVIADNPGCSALGLHLFFLRLCPSLQIQTDFIAKNVVWQEIVEAICVKGLGTVCLSLVEVLTKHPTYLRSYRLIFFINVLGELCFQDSVGQWDLFWNNLYQKTSAMVLVVIHDTELKWEEMKPKKGLWWFSSVQGEESVHIIRKV